MELNAEQVRQVEEIFEVKLIPALEKLWEKRAPEMQAAVATQVYRNIRKPLQREHAENRTRMQNAVREAEAAKIAAESASVNTSAMLDRINDHREDTTLLRAEISALQQSVNDWGQRLAHEAGEKAEKARLRARMWRWGKALGSVLGALLGGDGVAKIVERFHKH